MQEGKWLLMVGDEFTRAELCTASIERPLRMMVSLFPMTSALRDCMAARTCEFIVYAAGVDGGAELPLLGVLIHETGTYRGEIALTFHQNKYEGVMELHLIKSGNAK